MGLKLTGDWARARRMLEQGGDKLRQSVARALKQEAHALRNEIVKGITSQAPGGNTIDAPSELTVAKRKYLGFGGSKALIESGELRNSISVVTQGEEVFIGIARSAKSKDGKSMISVAELQENGSKPFIVPMTPAMRGFLFALMRDAGIEPHGGGKGGKGVVVGQIPARPFLQPAFERFQKGASRRFLDRMTRELGWK